MTINNSFNHPQVSNIKQTQSIKNTTPTPKAEHVATANASLFKKSKSKKIKSPITEFKLQKAKESLAAGLSLSSAEDIETRHKHVGVDLPELTER